MIKKGKRYEAVGHSGDGKIFLAWKACHRCGGTGTLGRGQKRNGKRGMVQCPCMRFTREPIKWVVL